MNILVFMSWIHGRVPCTQDIILANGMDALQGRCMFGPDRYWKMALQRGQQPYHGWVSHWDRETEGTPWSTAYFAPFPPSILARTCTYTRFIEQNMYVLLVKVKELMISLESSSTMENIQGVTGQGHFLQCPRSLTHRDPWLQGINDLQRTPNQSLDAWERPPNPSKMRLILLSFPDLSVLSLHLQ